MGAEKIAKSVAEELRKHMWAAASAAHANSMWFVWISRIAKDERGWLRAELHAYTMGNPDFAGMSALEIANEIQVQEARRAQEWAGDT
jgi:hypothetical protein